MRLYPRLAAGLYHGAARSDKATQPSLFGKMAFSPQLSDLWLTVDTIVGHENDLNNLIFLKINTRPVRTAQAHREEAIMLRTLLVRSPRITPAQRRYGNTTGSERGPRTC